MFNLNKFTNHRKKTLSPPNATTTTTTMTTTTTTKTKMKTNGSRSSSPAGSTHETHHRDQSDPGGIKEHSSSYPHASSYPPIVTNLLPETVQVSSSWGRKPPRMAGKQQPNQGAHHLRFLSEHVTTTTTSNSLASSPSSLQNSPTSISFPTSQHYASSAPTTTSTSGLTAQAQHRPRRDSDSRSHSFSSSTNPSLSSISSTSSSSTSPTSSSELSSSHRSPTPSPISLTISTPTSATITPTTTTSHHPVQHQTTPHLHPASAASSIPPRSITLPANTHHPSIPDPSYRVPPPRLRPGPSPLPLPTSGVVKDDCGRLTSSHPADDPHHKEADRSSSSSFSSISSDSDLIEPSSDRTLIVSNRSLSDYDDPRQPSSTPRPRDHLQSDLAIRQRASSYHHTPPGIPPTPSLSPPAAGPVRRPTSLFSSQPSTQAFQPSYLSNDQTPKSGKKSCRLKGRKAKADSRSNLPASTVASAAPGIASALALSGVSLVSHSTPTPFKLAENMQQSSSYTYGTSRSPDEKDDRSVHTTDSLNWSRTVSSIDDQLGTGYAVASRKRNVEFHAIFKSIPEDDYLIEDYGCALQRDILVQGRLYISEQHLCFNANIFGWVTSLVIPFSDVSTIEKRMTALIIPNAIQVNTTQSRHTFASFLSRDSTYELMSSIWRIAHPLGPISPTGSDPPPTPPDGLTEGTLDSCSSGLSHSSAPAPTKKVDHPPTQCDCSPDEHYKEVIWDAIYPISPEKLYNILFQSDFLKDFWVNEEHLTEIEVGDWITAPDAKFPSRFLSYIRPVNAPVGPKSIKCLVSDEHRALNFDQYVSILSTARTPDAPAGGSFCVKTTSCITWGPNNSSRWLVTAGVEWTKVNRFLKSIIESSAIGGQKTYQVAVDQALRKHLAQLEPSVDRSEISTGPAVTQIQDPSGASSHALEPSIAPVGQSRSKSVGHAPIVSHPASTRKRFSLSTTGQVNILGVQLSWMMVGSIGLVIILLVWNFVTVVWPVDRTGGEVKLSGRSGHQNTAYHGAVKHELTRDVAETVKEALHEYFRDHPMIPIRREFQGSNTSILKNFELEKDDHLKEQEGDEASSKRMASDPFAQMNHDHEEARRLGDLSPNEEMKEIEMMLEYLEMRIRNVRKSLVENRA